MLNQIINVTITRQTTPVSQAGFGTPLIVGEHTRFAERVKTYASLTEMTDDGFVAADEEYIAANAIFAQNPKLTQIKVGRKDVDPETYVEALQAIQAADDDWYAVILDSHDAADVQAVAAWIETQEKIFGTSSNDPNILVSAATTDIAYLLSQAEYERTFVMFSDTNDDYPEAALLGKQLPTDPGTTTWAYKTLAGITPDELTTAEAAAAHAKNAITYQTIAGVNITRYGQMASGEYIDTIRGVDWLAARLQEDIYSLLVNQPKIPFTDAGVASVEAAVKERLQDGVDIGFLAADPAPETSAPKVADVSTNDKANRTLPDITFTATLAGAIHKVTINGVVTV